MRRRATRFAYPGAPNVAPPFTPAPGFYVSPTGSSANNGSYDAPWSLAHALTGAGGTLVPGDTVWLLGLEYTLGAFSAVPEVLSYSANMTTACAGVMFSGTSPYPWLQPKIKGDLHVQAPGAVLRRFRVLWDFDTDRTSAQGGSPVPDVPRQHSGLWIEARDVTLIDVLVHDTGGAFGFFSQAAGVKTFDCVSYNNGWIGNDRGHGHAFYEQTGANPSLPADLHRHHALTTFCNFGAGGKFSGSDGTSNLIGFEMTGASIFDTSVPVRSTWQAQPLFIVDGADTRKGDITVQDSSFWMRDSGFHDYAAATRPVAVWIGDIAPGSRPLVFRRNRVQGRVRLGAWDSLTWFDNLVTSGNDAYPLLSGVALVQLQPAPAVYASYSWLKTRYLHNWSGPSWSDLIFVPESTALRLSQWQSTTGYDQGAGGNASTFTAGQLTAPEVYVVPSEATPGRAKVEIWNQGGAPTVQVDVSGVLSVGQTYALYHIYDWVSPTAPIPVLSGTYAGVSLTVPMVPKTPPTPQAWTALPDLPNTFGVFVLVGDVPDSTTAAAPLATTLHALTTPATGA